jgi:hypothetical protein
MGQERSTKMVYRLNALLGVLLLLVVLAVAGCGNKCDELQDTCTKCKDPAHKETCMTWVRADNGDNCEKQITVYQQGLDCK